MSPLARGRRRLSPPLLRTGLAGNEKGARRPLERVKIRSGQTALLIQSSSTDFGAAPVLFETTWPSLNMNSVGMPRTPIIACTIPRTMRGKGAAADEEVAAEGGEEAAEGGEESAES